MCSLKNCDSACQVVIHRDGSKKRFVWTSPHSCLIYCLMVAHSKMSTALPPCSLLSRVDEIESQSIFFRPHLPTKTMLPGRSKPATFSFFLGIRIFPSSNHALYHVGVVLTAAVRVLRAHSYSTPRLENFCTRCKPPTLGCDYLTKAGPTLIHDLVCPAPI